VILTPRFLSVIPRRGLPPGGCTGGTSGPGPSPRPTAWGRADPLTKFGLCAFMLDPEEIITSKSGYCRRHRDAALLQHSPPGRRIFHQQRQKGSFFSPCGRCGKTLPSPLVLQMTPFVRLRFPGEHFPHL